MSKREPRLSAKHEAALRSFGVRGWRFGKAVDKPLRRLAVLGYAQTVPSPALYQLWRLTEAGRARLERLGSGGRT